MFLNALLPIFANDLLILKSSTMNKSLAKRMVWLDRKFLIFCIEVFFIFQQHEILVNIKDLSLKTLVGPTRENRASNPL